MSGLLILITASWWCATSMLKPGQARNVGDGNGRRVRRTASSSSFDFPVSAGGTQPPHRAG